MENRRSTSCRGLGYARIIVSAVGKSFSEQRGKLPAERQQHFDLQQTRCVEVEVRSGQVPAITEPFRSSEGHYLNGAHLARLFYRMIKYGAEYVDHGVSAYEAGLDNN